MKHYVYSTLMASSASLMILPRGCGPVDMHAKTATAGDGRDDNGRKRVHFREAPASVCIIYMRLLTEIEKIFGFRSFLARVIFSHLGSEETCHRCCCC
jgi:hypothetical protein